MAALPLERALAADGSACEAEAFAADYLLELITKADELWRKYCVEKKPPMRGCTNFKRRLDRWHDEFWFASCRYHLCQEQNSPFPDQEYINELLDGCAFPPSPDIL